MHKYWVIILFFALFSCKTRKEATPIPAATTKNAPAKKDSIVEVKQPEPVKKKQFVLTLLLALNNQHYFEKDSLGEFLVPEIESLNNSALQFYEGMLMAAKGNDNDKNIHLNVLDVATDSLKVMKMLKDSLILRSDLVIPVAGASTINMAVKAAAAREFPLMSLSPVNSNLVNTYDKIWTVNPSNKTQCKLMAAYLKEHYPEAAYSIIYRGDNKKETDLGDLFNNELKMLFHDTLTRMINYNADGWSKLQKNLSASKKNILIVPSSDESFLTALFTKLDTHEEYSYVVVGLPTWEHFESLDFSLLEMLNTRIFNTTFIDYENEDVKKFRKQFIEEYHDDPLISAYNGYDIYKWINSNFKKSGNAISKYESKSSLTAPETGFNFVKLCDDCSYENQVISVLKLKEGSFTRAEK
jgi:hypothetical protein